MVLFNKISSPVPEKQKLTVKHGGASYGTMPSGKEWQWTTTRIELFLFLFFTAKYLSDEVITNLLESRECLVTQGLDMTNCTEPLSGAVEDLVQPGTATIISYKTVLETLIPAFPALLVGPWSDQNGRKPILIISLAGYALSYLIWAVLSLLPQLRPEVFLLASVPVALMGSSVYLLTYCYISDVTDINSRASRMVLLTISIKAATMVGASGAPLLIFIQNSFNPYALIFFLSAFVIFLTTIFTHYCLEESICIHPNRETRFFVFTNVKQLFSTSFKRRPNHGRTIILLLVWIISIRLTELIAERSFMYLSTKEMFSWQLTDYVAFDCFDQIITGIGGYAGVKVLVSWMGLSNMVASILICSLQFLHYVVVILATTGTMFYFASLINIFNSATTSLCRTEISLLVPSAELGKVFALTEFLEAIFPTFSVSAYSLVYQATFLTNPSSIYWLSSALTILCATMLLISIILQKDKTRLTNNTS